MSEANNMESAEQRLERIKAEARAFALSGTTKKQTTQKAAANELEQAPKTRAQRRQREEAEKEKQEKKKEQRKKSAAERKQRQKEEKEKQETIREERRNYQRTYRAKKKKERADEESCTMTINNDVPQEIVVTAEPIDIFTKRKTWEERYEDLKKNEAYANIPDQLLRDLAVPVPGPYERLKKVYTLLSDHHKELLRDLGEPVPDGPCTKMTNDVNFAKPIEEHLCESSWFPVDAPFPIDSITNRFGTLIFNLLHACDLGSVSGDAYRMQMVLEAAIEDTIRSISIHDDMIEHLMGLTMAIVQHGIGPFLDKGDQECGQRLFKEMAHEWKKFFGHHPESYNLNMEFHNFAKVYGFEMQTMLKSAHYNFNFIRIPRKRKSPSPDKENTDPTQKKKKPPTKMEIFMERVNAVEGVSSGDDVKIYDSCPEVRSKIRAFLDRDGVTKRNFCQCALGNTNHNSLNQFLNAQGQKRSGTIAYKRAYVFFEKLRILEDEPKSFARLRNEDKLPAGFSCEPDKGGRPSAIFYDPRLPFYTRSEVSF